MFILALLIATAASELVPMVEQNEVTSISPRIIQKGIKFIQINSLIRIIADKYHPKADGTDSDQQKIGKI